MPRLLAYSLGWAIFLLAIAGPTIGLIVRTVFAFAAPVGGFAFSTRQALLLGKTVGLAALAAVIALVVSLPGAYLMGQSGRLSRRPLLAVMLAAPLFLPPSVYVFGWQRILPPYFPNWLQCIGVWALWAYPIPALLIGIGWARSGRAAYETALLDAAPAAAFRTIVLPLLSRYVALSTLLLMVLFLGDYGVPHACAVPVFSTELMSWALDSRRPIDTLWPALPGAALVLVGLLLAFQSWRRCVPSETNPGAGPAAVAVSRRATALALTVFVIAAVLPLTVLAIQMGSFRPMRIALQTYPRELAGSLAIAAAAGILTIVMGLGVSLSPRWRDSALIWALAFGALPGALVGEALLITYLPWAVAKEESGVGLIVKAVDLIYTSPLIVIFGYVARFGWIGILAVRAGLDATAEECVMQARTDGADESAVAWRIRLPAAWPMLLVAACLIAALALAEIPTSALVQVPSLGLISQILIEKFHKAEDGLLISLSFWLVLAVLPAGWLLGFTLRRGNPTRLSDAGNEG